MRLPLFLDVTQIGAWANDMVRSLEVTISNMERNKQTIGSVHRLPIYAKADLPVATPAGQLLYVSDDVGGAVPAFSDGTNWRRVTDRAVIS